jgi:hypothetical protein
MFKEPHCNCFKETDQQEWTELAFHSEQQDTTCDAWKHLLNLIEEAATDGREEFAPWHEMTREERSQIVTLPPTISKLKLVKRFNLYESFLVRIPPEIGDMTSLEEFTPYTSYKLHWYPYEITRCKNLKESTVSTRALYGNYKFRPPFPKLQAGMNTTRGLDLNNLPLEVWGTNLIKTCSVCNRRLENRGLYQVWISLPVAIDVLPLLVNACSEVCIQSLPVPPANYVQQPHKGGIGIKQPPTEF